MKKNEENSKTKHKHRHKHLNHSQKSNKSNNIYRYNNNIKIQKLNKSDDEETIRRDMHNFNYGNGNYFYEDKTDKYIYNYYLNRSINCPACIIGNCNSERGFSPVICYHLKEKRNNESSEENEKNQEDDNKNNKVNK